MLLIVIFFESARQPISLMNIKMNFSDSELTLSLHKKYYVHLYCVNIIFLFVFENRTLLMKLRTKTTASKCRFTYNHCIMHKLCIQIYNFNMYSQVPCPETLYCICILMRCWQILIKIMVIMIMTKNFIENPCGKDLQVQFQSSCHLVTPKYYDAYSDVNLETTFF